MLILVMIILCLVTGITFYMHHQLLGSLAVILLVITQVLLVVDSQVHFATNINESQHILRIRPIASIHGNHIMVTKNVKEGKTIYQAFVTKDPHSKTKIILNKDKRVLVDRGSHQSNQMVTNDYRYTYTNQLANLLFAGITNQNQLKSQTITYRLDSDWYLLKKSQLKTVAQQLKSTPFQQRLKTDVKLKLHQAVKKAPNLVKHPKTLKKYQNQFVKEDIGHWLQKYATT